MNLLLKLLSVYCTVDQEFMCYRKQMWNYFEEKYGSEEEDSLETGL
jgi:hypothetical protein